MKSNEIVKQIIVFIILILISGCNSVETGSVIETRANSRFYTPFPRLGMWWPDPWEQSLDDIARYDWIILFPYMEEFIDPIKKINSDILIITATNACELGYDSSGDYPENNIDVLAIPPEWFLTQVGTALTQSVNAASTVLHVEKLSVSDGKETFQLFIPGDTVLIDGESVLVESINGKAKTLTVKRGFIRPASAHAAGTRIAAHITFWPDSWLLNLSTMSPKAEVDLSIGKESWAEYNSRIAAGLLSNPEWDGILLDRTDPNQSWLIGGSTSRTIDPDQSNTLITDYSEFDNSWNDGLRIYESKLRKIIGEDKIIFTNWGVDNYDLINGNNYEGFPLDNSRSYQGTWRQTVFGTIPDVGSYSEWLATGQNPNITMIETYEDDGFPESSSDGIYDNPYNDPSFIPNYQKMRFGLTSALLGDGYYSYEINTNGHGSLGLLWFDEYDNAGEGRGYLGLPLGSAYRVSENYLAENLLSGSGFNSKADLEKWEFWTDDGNTAAVTLDKKTDASRNTSVRIDIVETLGNDWQISLLHNSLTIKQGKEYTLSFLAKASLDSSLSSWVAEAGEPWENYMDFSRVNLTTVWHQYELTAIATGSDDLAKLQFGLGEQSGSVWLDDILLQEGNEDLWRRDYEKGIVLVNATAVSKIIDLNGEFRKIKGKQVPKINDGSIVNEVKLQPYDGIILLRE